MANEKNKKSSIDLSTFTKSVDRMIATSDRSYDGKLSFRKGDLYYNYTREEISQILERGDTDNLRSLSRSFCYLNGFYKRFLIYYATLLKYIYILIPHVKDGYKIEDKKCFDLYRKSLNFIDVINIKTLSKHVAIKVLIEGAYYGVLRSFGSNSYAVQDLPADYCRSRFNNQDNVAIVEMNVSYFDKLHDKNTKDQVLKAYPKELRDGYWNHKNHGGDKWVIITPGDGLYFKLFDERPVFANIIPAVIDFNDYRKIEKEKDEQELHNLLVQRLPIEDGELVFDPEEAEEIHRGAVDMLRGNRGLDVLTTFAEVKLESTESNRSVVTNNLEKIEKSIYSEAGVSKQLFNAEGNTALANSIINDMSMMLVLGDQIANWVKFNLNAKFGNSIISFGYTCLPISHYNEQDVRRDALAMAQAGYSFLLPALAFDLSQNDLLDIKNLEINALHLDKVMKPLASSFTQSAGGANTDLTKVNELPDQKKSEKTIENNDSAS